MLIFLILFAVILLLTIFIIALALKKDQKVFNSLKEVPFATLYDGPFDNIINYDDKTGLASYIKDSYGVEYWFVYDKYGRLIEFRNSNGEHQKFDYSDYMRIKAKLKKKNNK